MAMRGEKKFRVFLIYMNPTYAGNDEESEKILQSKIKKWCVGQSLKKVSMLWVPSPVDEETCGAYNINPQAENTVFVYKKRKAVAKWVNINFDEATENILSRFQ